MSFWEKLKKKLGGQISAARHCQIAELSALISMCGSVMIDSDNRYAIKIHTENIDCCKKVLYITGKNI